MNLKKLPLWIPFAMVVFVLVIIRLSQSANQESAITQPAKPFVSINQHQVSVEIADDESEHLKGLSERDSLPSDHGMLFIFGNADEHGIWMKGMRFNIDILWLDHDRRIIAIVQDMSPDSYPQVVKPNRPAKYVLEVNSGIVKQQGWQIGQLAEFQLQ